MYPLSGASHTQATQLCSATPPHIHTMFRYITIHEEFYEGFPHVGIASDMLRLLGMRLLIDGQLFFWPMYPS